jgi:hypothetical protein
MDADARSALGTRERFDDIVDAICAWHEEARASRVFGMPCVKRAGKVVFGLSRTGMVFKLTDPGAHRRALAVPGAHLFDPSGHGEPFRQWVVVPPGQADEWEALAYEALGQDHSVPPEALGDRARGEAEVSSPPANRLKPAATRHARCVNQQSRSRSRKTQTFCPDSSTTS